MAKTLLSFGHGYSAQALAQLLIPQGWRVIGTTRNPAKAQTFRAEGVEPLIWPSDLRPALAEATHILCSAAPDSAGDPFLRSVPEIAQSRGSPGVQAPAEIGRDLERRLAALHAVADRIYDRWSEGLIRGS